MGCQMRCFSGVRSGMDHWHALGGLRMARLAPVVLALVMGCLLGRPLVGARAPASAPEEHFRATSWTTEEGLPQNTVTALEQTRDGYLWIGTRYGLARLDGVRLTSYEDELAAIRADPPSLRGLVEDTEGRLWLYSDTWLASRERGVFKRVSTDDMPFHGRIQHVARSRDGGLWIVMVNGMFLWKNGHCERRLSRASFLGEFDGRDLELERAWEDKDGGVWIKIGWDSGQRTIWRKSAVNTPAGKASEPPSEFQREGVGDIFRDRVGRLWAGRPGTLLCWDGTLATIPANEVWGDNIIKEMCEDDRGGLWILSKGDRQVHRYANGKFTSFGRAEGLPNPDDVRCLLADREGSLWIGSGAGGLCMLQPRPLVSVLTGSYSAMDEVFSVSPGVGDRVWMATTYGLVEYLDGSFQVHTNFDGIRDGGNVMRTRTVLQDRSGRVWCGMDHNTPHELRNGTLVPAGEFHIRQEGRRRVRGIFEDRAGTLWMASQEGLWQRGGGISRLWTTNDGLGDNALCGLAEDAQGSLWVGSDQGGIHRFQDGRFARFTTRDGLLHDNAWPLRAEPDGSMWVGTPRGLNRIRGHEIRSVTKAQGLFDNLAYCLLLDGRERYWTFCNRGIWRVRRSDLNAVADGALAMLTSVSYGKADGMASTEGNGDEQPNAAALPDGQFWFPTTRGVAILKPNEVPDNELPPTPVIEEARADDQAIYLDGMFPGANTGLASSRSNPTHGLRLAPGRARVLEVRYTAATFVDSGAARFRYRLEGREASWREAGGRRLAVYTELGPGDYRFLVDACNSHGYWSRKPAEFAFTLEPHYYQTWAFRWAMGLAAGGLLTFAHFKRLSIRSRRHQDQERRLVDLERTRIARDLHDDLGASLTGIALQIEAVQALKDPGEKRHQLDHLAGGLRAAVARMRETIWTINPQCDTLDSYCGFLGQHAGSIIGAAGLRCRLDLPLDAPPLTLSAKTRHHMILIAKEAITNAVKHSGASEVRVSVRVEGDELLLVVEDDGRGMPGRSDDRTKPTSPSGSGLGIANMRERVAALNGRFTLESSPATGTRILVKIPTARNNITSED